ncbi:MAG: DUF3090 family protein [Acidimicrobiia bacterium]
MGDFIELDPVDHLAAGALGVPGQRTFLIQARRGATEVVVLVEKDQVAMLASEADAFLDRVAEEYPEPEGLGAASTGVDAELDEPGDPMFRAQLIGLGFDPQRDLVLLELRERPPVEEPDEGEPADGEGALVRCHATRAQVRAMAVRALEAVAAGRPLCPLCEFPMDPAGHICPRWN